MVEAEDHNLQSARDDGIQDQETKVGLEISNPRLPCWSSRVVYVNCCQGTVQTYELTDHLGHAHFLLMYWVQVLALFLAQTSC